MSEEKKANYKKKKLTKEQRKGRMKWNICIFLILLSLVVQMKVTEDMEMTNNDGKIEVEIEGKLHGWVNSKSHIHGYYENDTYVEDEYGLSVVLEDGSVFAFTTEDRYNEINPSYVEEEKVYVYLKKVGDKYYEDNYTI